jgi:hypothetical protein
MVLSFSSSQYVFKHIVHHLSALGMSDPDDERKSAHPGAEIWAIESCESTRLSHGVLNRGNGNQPTAPLGLIFNPITG